MTACFLSQEDVTRSSVFRRSAPDPMPHVAKRPLGVANLVLRRREPLGTLGPSHHHKTAKEKRGFMTQLDAPAILPAGLGRDPAPGAMSGTAPPSSASGIV